MYLFAGLGNPEKKYELNRHNVGFLTIDYIIKEIINTNLKQKENYLFNKVKYKGEDLIITKPLTYMNNSGIAIAKLANYFKIPDENILIIHDDISLPFGKVRLRLKGSHGGHNGLKSIESSLGSRNYMRLKVGVGAPKGEGHTNLVSHVLGNFSKKEQNILNNYFFKDMDDFINFIISDQKNKCMNIFNGKNYINGEDI